MPKFAYVGVTLDGSEVKGTHRAASRADAEVALYERQLRHLRVTEKKSILQYEISGPRIKREEVMHLSRQLAAFVAGRPAAHRGGPHDRHRERELLGAPDDERDRGRAALGRAVLRLPGQFPKVFPPFYRGILRSAELTGQLDTVLAQLSDYIERDLEARRKLKSAMMYPAHRLG